MWEVSGKGEEGRYSESTVVRELAKRPFAWVRLQPEGDLSPPLLSSLARQKFIVIVNLLRF